MQDAADRRKRRPPPPPLSRLRVVRRCGALLAPALEHPLARRLQRLDQQRAVLGREPCAEKERAVVVEVVVDVLQLVRFAGVLRRNPAERPQRPLELRCRQRARKLEQALLGRRRRDPGQRPNLGERELAAPERRPRRRQLLQRLCDPQELTRLTRRDPAAPRDKGLQVAAVALLVHLPDELEPACGRRAQVCGQARKLVHAAIRRRLARRHILANPLDRRCLH